MGSRPFIAPLVCAVAIACSGVAAFGGDLDRHWEAYSALSTPGPETRSGVPATTVSFQFV